MGSKPRTPRFTKTTLSPITSSLSPSHSCLQGCLSLFVFANSLWIAGKRVRVAFRSRATLVCADCWRLWPEIPRCSRFFDGQLVCFASHLYRFNSPAQFIASFAEVFSKLSHLFLSCCAFVILAIQSDHRCRIYCVCEWDVTFFSFCMFIVYQMATTHTQSRLSFRRLLRSATKCAQYG